MLKVAIFIGLIVICSMAQATDYYYVDGKSVPKGQALITSLTEGKEILQVKVNVVKGNQEKATLRKQRDASLSDVPECK